MLDRKTMLDYLNQGAFEDLFIEELGWDEALIPPLDVEVDGATYLLRPVAQKRGLTVLKLQHDPIPLYATRRKIETQVAKRFREHIIIFVNGDNREQIWQWAYREQGRPLQIREQRYQRGQRGEALRQKLERIRFTLEQEEDLDLIDVVGQVRAAFNVERATRRFFREFKKQHDVFQKFLQGIPDKDLESWYVSVMLNRLMFIYFIQKKGFLDGDIDYLRNKLKESQSDGQDRYYQDFLCPLFFEGFAKPESQRDPSLKKLLGKVPYLNGGIFQRHQIEQLYGKAIHIPDKAFQQLFDFFDRYHWHLDDRPLRKDNEINPDVLGYIFEQYVNQRQMGAYYTKEDITEYISKNTIIPFLFESVQKQSKSKRSNAFWKLLQDDPDRYIYDAMKKGAELSLPPEIEAGLEDVNKRDKWNTPTPEKFGLPTEIWRETVARRQRYEEIKEKLSRGAVHDIDDFVTLNLDIRQFIQDVIERTEDPDVVRAFWKAATSVSVLDPACGSGAFLFAALNILEPIYEASLDRMRQFLAELPPEASSQKFSDFRKTLEDIERHPNEQYFILKRIMVDNLFGVDIMEEAIEIAKLRLFLKLVALVEDVNLLEPLPDIDFNIRAGNTLVGFTNLGEMERVLLGVGSDQERLLLLPEDEKLLREIKKEAIAVDHLFSRFREMQTLYNLGEWNTDFSSAKLELHIRLSGLAEKLNQLLALQYGVDPEQIEYISWVKDHRPFHWFVEFYGIMDRGGFDVIIGNPPYVEYSRIRSTYSIKSYDTLSCGNLYAFVIERSVKISASNSRTGLIVPISLTSAQRMKPLQDFLFTNSQVLWLSNFGLRPAALFPGVMQRLTIAIIKKGESPVAFVTDYLTWYAEERLVLFDTIQYVTLDDLRQEYSIPKVNNIVSRSALLKILKQGRYWHSYRQFKGDYTLYYHNAGGYWNKTFNYKPYYRSLVDSKKKHTTISELHLPSRDLQNTYLALLNSTTFYFFWKSTTDARHIYPSDIAMFPISLPISKSLLTHLELVVAELMNCFRKNSSRIIYGRAEVDQVRVAPCKSIIDQIDRILADHYHFTDQEIDFIVNYDIKYRMGDALFDTK